MALSATLRRRSISTIQSLLLRSLSSSTTTPPPPLSLSSSSSTAIRRQRSVAAQSQSRSFRSTSFVMSQGRQFTQYQEGDEIGADTILFEGCDYNHWLFTIDFPKDPKPTPEEMVRTYEETCAKGLGISIEEAKRKIYACSTTTYQGFQAIMTEEESEKFKDIPGVVFILPDSYIDPVNKEYGGDKYENGVITHRPPPAMYGRNIGGRFNDRNRNPQQQRFNQRGPNENHQGNMQGDRRNYGPPQNNPPQGNLGPQNNSPQGNFGPPQNNPPQGNFGPSQNNPPQGNFGPPQNNPSQQNYPPQQNGPQQGFSPQQNYAPQQNIPPQQRPQQYNPPQQNGPQQGFPPQQYRPQQHFQSQQDFGSGGRDGQSMHGNMNQGQPAPYRQGGQNYNGQGGQNYNGQVGQDYSGQGGRNYPGQGGPGFSRDE
ncbi:hypothetical protein ACFE04_021989 [Oxalis oulophora]